MYYGSAQVGHLYFLGEVLQTPQSWSGSGMVVYGDLEMVCGGVKMKTVCAQGRIRKCGVYNSCGKNVVELQMMRIPKKSSEVQAHALTAIPKRLNPAMIPSH